MLLSCLLLALVSVSLRIDIDGNSSGGDKGAYEPECIYIGKANLSPAAVPIISGSWMSDGPVDFTVYRKGASNFIKNVKDSEAETVTVQRPGPDAKEDSQSMLCWVNSSRTDRSVNFIFKESNKSDVASTNELQETEQMIEDLEDTVAVLEVNLESQISQHDDNRASQERTFSQLKIMTAVEAAILTVAAFCQLRVLKGAFATEVLI